MTFNLTSEPWLPCLMPDNSLTEMGLEEALVSAPKIRELSDPSPIVTFALHRLLLAILHRNFGPENESEWKALWERGSWNREALSGYMHRVRSRFELFAPERPF